ncbi:hypothetical protein AK966_14865 [Vibrio sp. PID23_8]|jgi:hypothetical protein|nr:hypothetical protein AK966_14865 [Vibrio sp. PID23_8]
MLTQLVASPFMLECEAVFIKVSIGVVQTHARQNMPLWLRNASIALSDTKQDTQTGMRLSSRDGERIKIPHENGDPNSNRN